MRSELEKGLNNLLDLRKHWTERAASSAHPGELDIRLFETPPHFRLYVFDPNRPRGSTYFIPYASVVSSTVLPGYLLENVDTGVYKAYFNYVLPLIGRLVSGHRTAYQYLPRSVANFPVEEELASKMKQAGCRHLPVVEGDRLVGMVSQRDLLQIDLSEKDEEIRWLNAYIHFIPPAREGTS